MRSEPLSVIRLVLPRIVLLGILAATGCTSNNGATTSSPPISSQTTAATTTPTPTTLPVTTTPNPTPTTVPTTPAPSSYTVSVASKAGIGNYLVDSRGITLYYTVSDRPGYSNLPDETLTAWPVFYVSSLVLPTSLSAADFGTYTRDNNVKQTTYKGYPLYYSFQDHSPGDTFGNRLGGVWFVVSP